MIEEIPKDGPYMTPENYLKKKELQQSIIGPKRA